MQDFAGFSTALAVLASAAGCGLLMGIERERRKGAGPDRALAGVRSFTLAAIGGATAALTGIPALMAVGAALVAALTVVAYARDRSGDPGVTTEIALLLAYLIGVTCARDQLLAAALAVVVTGLMALRDTLHQFANQWLQPGEVRSGLILAALALLVYPLAPDTPLWQGVLNPQVMVRLVIVLLVIQSLAHVAKRLMQARHALALSALASGFVSSTATIASLGMEVRTGHSAPRAHAGAAVLSCVATMVQIAVVAATVQPQWLARLWLPALAGGCVAAAMGWWSGRGTAHRLASAPSAEAAPGVAGCLGYLQPVPAFAACAGSGSRPAGGVDGDSQRVLLPGPASHRAGAVCGDGGAQHCFHCTDAAPGAAFYGYGFAGSMLVTLCTGMVLLTRQLNRLEYETFMLQ